MAVFMTKTDLLLQIKISDTSVTVLLVNVEALSEYLAMAHKK
jgi:hypothetical protein